MRDNRSFDPTPFRLGRRFVPVISLLFVAFLIVGTSLSVSASEPPASSATVMKSGVPLRSAIQEVRRRDKIAKSKAYEASALERVLLLIEQKKVLERFRSGYHHLFPVFGGLSTGSGFAFGPLFRNDILADGTEVAVSAIWSFKRYQQYELRLVSLLSDRRPVIVGFHSRYRNFPEEDFFGLGPRSQRDNETDYKLEETWVRSGLDFQVVPYLKTGVHGGFQKTRTGSGGSDKVPSLEEIFSIEDAPGFSEEMDHWFVEFNAQVDLRDSPGNPRSGLAFFFQQDFFSERREGRYGFRRSQFEFQGYLPFLHKHRVLTLRLRGTDTRAEKGQIVPFFALPTVGGHNSLRGFRELRFQDRIAVLANLEYRFEAFIGLDIAVFADLGRVAGSWDDLRLSDLESSYGTGFRFNTARSVFLRIDIGHSVEGTRFFFKFENVY